MEDLINDIQERTGLPADKVLEVVTMVTDYMRHALPEDLVAQVSAYLGVAAEQAGEAANTAGAAAASATASASSGASDVVGMATGMAGSAVSAATDALKDFTSTTPDE
ncbi:MAG: hypothetical protein ACR2N7_09235 [Acidimicrobiia bacterium]